VRIITAPNEKNRNKFLSTMMTKDDDMANAANGAEGDDNGSFLADETMATAAMDDNEQTTEKDLHATAVGPIPEEEEEEERPPPRLMITKMVSNRARPASEVLE
jgi:hypothetical protein